MSSPSRAVDDPGARAEREQGPPVDLARLRLLADRQEIGDPPGAADEIDVAAERARGEIDGVIDNQPAARVHLAVAQIERLGDADRADEIVRLAEQSGSMSALVISTWRANKHQAELILLRDLAGEIEPEAGLQFVVAVEVEGQRVEPGLEAEIAVEEIGIFPENFPFVAAAATIPPKSRCGRP